MMAKRRRRPGRKLGAALTRAAEIRRRADVLFEAEVSGGPARYAELVFTLDGMTTEDAEELRWLSRIHDRTMTEATNEEK